MTGKTGVIVGDLEQKLLLLVAQKIVKQIRKKVLIRYPVKVKWARLDGFYADCNLYDRPRRHFLIRLSIEKIRSVAEIEDTMIHELAHAATWYDLPLEDHSDLWGVAFARIYRAFYGVT